MTPLIDVLKAKTDETGNDYVKDISNRFLQLVYMQGATLNTMAKFSKPADTQFLFELYKQAMENNEKLKRDRKSPINHLGCIDAAL